MKARVEDMFHADEEAEEVACSQIREKLPTIA